MNQCVKLMIVPFIITSSASLCLLNASLLDALEDHALPSEDQLPTVSWSLCLTVWTSYECRLAGAI